VPSHKPAGVLVADTDRAFTKAVSGFVAGSGWKAFTASDGPLALDILLAEPIRLAILRVDLPTMDGLEVVRTARAKGRRFHVAFLDACERSMTRVRCLELGALAYMVNLPSPQPLAQVLSDALRRPPPGGNGCPAATTTASELAAGAKVQLFIGAGPSAGCYPGVVVDSNPSSLVLSAWASDGSPVSLSLGTPVTVGFVAERSWGELQSSVTGSYITRSLAEVMVSRAGSVIYRQRRDFPRFPASLPLRAWPLHSPDPAGLMASGRTEDVSEYGLRACFDTPIASDVPVRLAIAPALGTEETRLTARCVWHESPRAAGPQEYRYGFRFERLMPEERQRLKALLAHVKSLSDDPGAGWWPEAIGQEASGPPASDLV